MAETSHFQDIGRGCTKLRRGFLGATNIKFTLAVIMVAVLAGCWSGKTAWEGRRLKWLPTQLANTNCPDLSGRYAASSPETYYYIFPYHWGVKRLSGKLHVKDRDNGRKITIMVSTRPDGIRIKADNVEDRVDTFTPYDGRSFGCQDGMLINRFQGAPLDTEGLRECSAKHQGGSYYGEYFYSVNSEGDILVRRDRHLQCDPGSSYRVLPFEESFPKSGQLLFRRVK